MPSRCTQIALVLGYLTPAGATQFRGGLEKPEESATALPVLPEIFEIPEFEPSFGKYPERLQITKKQMEWTRNPEFEKAPLEINDFNKLNKQEVVEPQLESVKIQNDFLRRNGIEPREGLDILVPKHREKLLDHYEELNKPKEWDPSRGKYKKEHMKRMKENLKLEEELYAQRREHHQDRKTAFDDLQAKYPDIPQEVPQTADGLRKLNLTVDELRAKNAELKKLRFEEGLEKVASDKLGKIYKEKNAETEKKDAKKAKSKETKNKLMGGGIAIVAVGGITTYVGTKAAEAPADNENKEDQGTK